MTMVVYLMIIRVPCNIKIMGDLFNVAGIRRNINTMMDLLNDH